LLRMNIMGIYCE